MKHIVVDLEMNAIDKAYRISTDKGLCKDEVIEIGAVMLDDNLQEISDFRVYVKPQLNDHIMPFIEKLTGITDEMVENAPCFEQAFEMFTQWCYGTGDDITVYAWSENDYSQIIREVAGKELYLSEKEKQLIADEWMDFQDEFDKRIYMHRHLSLSAALDLAGLEFNGRAHDALDDARNTAQLLEIVRDENLFNVTFKYVNDLMNPEPSGFCLGDMVDFSKFVVA